MTSPTQHVNPTTKLFRVAIVRLQSILLDIKKKVIVSDTSVSKLSTLFGASKQSKSEAEATCSAASFASLKVLIFVSSS